MNQSCIAPTIFLVYQRPNDHRRNMDSDSASDPAAAGVGPASIPASSSSSVDANVEVTRRAGCSLLPHGGYTLILATLSTLGWICSLAQDGCDYSRLEGPTVEALTNVGGVPYLEGEFVG